MTGKTHRVGGVLCCLGGYALLESNGLLLADVNPLLQLTVMYPFAIYGSVVSDLDHHWQSTPSKDVVSTGINKVLHLTTGIRDKMNKNTALYKMLGLFDAKHRSWQTHSDLFLIVMVAIGYYLLNMSITGADQVLVRLVSMGMILGIISHLILDMLTPEGVWCMGLVAIGGITGKRSFPKKLKFVPNTEFFRTGGTWEHFIRVLMWIGCIVLFFIIIYNQLKL